MFPKPISVHQVAVTEMKDLACSHVQWHVIGPSLSRFLCRAVLPLSQSTGPPRLVSRAALAPGAPYPPLSFVSTRLFLILSFSPLTACAAFYPVLNMLSQKCPPRLGSVVWLGMVQPAGVLCLAQSSSLSSLPCCQYLASYTQHNQSSVALQVLHHPYGWFRNRTPAEQGCGRVSC